MHHTVNRALHLQEQIAYALFLTLGVINIVLVIMICIYLLLAGLPAIGEIGLADFMFGTTWASTASTPLFGILPFILTSFCGTLGAIAIGMPLGFFSAVYLSFFAGERLRQVALGFVDLLAGIPSVIFGFMGMIVLIPLLQAVFGLPDGASMLAAILVLSIMILPSIIKVTCVALESVPVEYRDGSLALGATETETCFRVVVPAARSGIAAAFVLGVGRAIGEAMAVMMVSGNVANMPGLFDSVRFLTSAVASEMSYSQGLQKEALFSIALVLFFFILLINATLNLLLKKGLRK